MTKIKTEADIKRLFNKHAAPRGFKLSKTRIVANNLSRNRKSKNLSHIIEETALNSTVEVFAIVMITLIYFYLKNVVDATPLPHKERVVIFNGIILFIDHAFSSLLIRNMDRTKGLVYEIIKIGLLTVNSANYDSDYDDIDPMIASSALNIIRIGFRNLIAQDSTVAQEIGDAIIFLSKIIGFSYYASMMLNPNVKQTKSDDWKEYDKKADNAYDKQDSRRFSRREYQERTAKADKDWRTKYGNAKAWFKSAFTGKSGYGSSGGSSGGSSYKTASGNSEEHREYMNILGIKNPKPTKTEVLNAWKQQSKTQHPDVGGSVDAQQKLNSAKEYFMKFFESALIYNFIYTINS